MLTAILISAVLAGAVLAQNDMNLVKLTNAVSDGAVCLDGSPIAYYIRQNTSSTQWVIFFQGGGWCYNLNDCYGRAQTVLGSSTTYPPTMTSGGVFSNDPQMNPDFYTWNAVHLQYCDGASWTGNADLPVNVSGMNLYFRGRRGLDAVIQSLSAAGLSQATDLLVAGCSAGGLATYFHADYIASFFPNTNTKAMPVSGFFLNVTNIVGDYVYGTQMTQVFTFQNSTGGVHQGCIAANPGNEQICIFAENTFPYIQTPIFPLNSMYDTWQLACIVTSTINPEACSAFPEWTACMSNPEACNSTQVEYLNQFHNTFLTRFVTNPTFGSANNGAFLDSCLGHCEADPYDISGINVNDWSSMTIAGVDATTAVGNWYFGRTQNNKYIDCELNLESPVACNPSCGQSFGRK